MNCTFGHFSLTAWAINGSGSFLMFQVHNQSAAFLLDNLFYAQYER